MSRTFVRWVGGKSKVAHHIINEIPLDHLAYIEPFFGSGAVLFQKRKSAVEIANDACGDLVSFYKVIQERPQELVDAFRYVLIHEKTFNDLALSRPTDELQKAVRLYFLSRVCFAGDVSKPYFSPSARSAGSPNTKWTETLERDFELMHKRIRSVLFLCRRAEEVLQMADENSIVYCDPPYPGTHGYAFDLDWDFMIEWLGTTSAKWILSINDIPLIREEVVPKALSKGGKAITINLYRGISRESSGRKKYKELLITNFRNDPEEQATVMANDDLSDLPLFRGMQNE